MIGFSLRFQIINLNSAKLLIEIVISKRRRRANFSVSTRYLEKIQPPRLLNFGKKSRPPAYSNPPVYLIPKSTLHGDQIEKGQLRYSLL